MQSVTPLSSDAPGPRLAQPELRILLVEDSAPLRLRLAELLTEPGVMRVTATAETEAEACSLIAGRDFDALVVDVELREGSGINVVRRARTRWVVPPLPLIIVLTNYALPTVKDRCFAAGADHFLDKMRQFDQMHPLILALRN
jgi:two-component system, OmpR family, response regulator